MQPVVDNKKPRELPMSGKKEIERRRFRDKVEQGNRLLLDRLGKALDRKNIDNERKAIKFNSLEQGKKKLELKRVTMENQLLLNRIQFAQPMYDHNQWERDAEHREFYLKNMTEFPEMYCPHYPPMRKAFLKELEEKEKAKNEATLTRLNKKRAKDNLPPLVSLPPLRHTSPIARGASATMAEDADMVGRGPFSEYRPGTVDPPTGLPAWGVYRPGPNSPSGRAASASPDGKAGHFPASPPNKQIQMALDNVDAHTLLQFQNMQLQQHHQQQQLSPLR